MTLIFPLAIPAAIILGMVAFVWIAISTLKKLKSDSGTIKSLRTELGKSSKALEKAYAQIKDMQREIDSLKAANISSLKDNLLVESLAFLVNQFLFAYL